VRLRGAKRRSAVRNSRDIAKNSLHKTPKNAPEIQIEYSPKHPPNQRYLISVSLAQYLNEQNPYERRQNELIVRDVFARLKYKIGRPCR
jgi:hypothetical protein